MYLSTKKLVDYAQGFTPRDDIDRIYVLRKGRRKELTGIEDIVDASIQGLEKNIKKSKEKLMASNSNDNIGTNRKTSQTRKQNWEKKLYGYFKWQTVEIAY